MNSSKPEQKQDLSFTKLTYYKWYIISEQTYGALFALCEVCGKTLEQEPTLGNDFDRSLVKVDSPCFAQYCSSPEHKRLKAAANVGGNSSPK